MQKNSHDVGTYLLEKLSDLRTKFEFVGDVRGKGLMIGIELVTDKKSKTPMEKSDFEFIIEETKNLGVIFGRGGRCANVRSKKAKERIILFTKLIIMFLFTGYSNQASNVYN